MSEQTLTVGMIHQDDSEWAVLSLEAVEPIADEIIIVDGGSEKHHLDKLTAFIDGREKFKIIYNKYPGSNGAQYNKVLEFASKDWILIIDCDEVISDDAHLLLEYLRQDELSVFSIRMNHCIYNLGLLDSTHAGTGIDPDYIHYVPKRLFRNKPGIYYESKEHVVITGFSDAEHGLINDVSLWHYGKSKAMMGLKEKYEMNLKRSNIHDKGFLEWWYQSLLRGEYPVKKLSDLKQHPSVVRREFYL